MLCIEASNSAKEQYVRIGHWQWQIFGCAAGWQLVIHVRALLRAELFPAENGDTGTAGGFRFDCRQQRH